MGHHLFYILPMKVLRVPFRLPPDPPRSGVHLSDILKDILRIQEPKRYGLPVTVVSHHTFQKGYSWEDFLKTRSVWPAHVLLQQEFILDRIICTLDGFSLEKECVFESKATFLSCGRSILDPAFRSWKWQLMGYCRASGVRRAQLDALFLNGDWSPPRTQAHSYRWIFKTSELKQNWLMITRHRDRMIREGRLKETT